MRTTVCCRYLIAVAFLINAAAPIQAKAEDALMEGLASLADGQFEQAATQLSSFVRDNPRHPSVAKAMCGAGQAMASLGQDEAAVGMFAAALDQKSASLRETPLRLAMARCFLRMDSPDEAAKHCTDAIRMATERRERAVAYPMLITAFCHAGKFHEAWEALRNAVKSGDLKVDVLLSLANQVAAKALSSGQPKTAAEAFQWQLENGQSEQAKQQAALGYAWAQSALANSDEEAADALLSYVDEYPRSNGAAEALLAAAKKKVASNSDGAQSLFERLADSYPESNEATDALDALIKIAEQNDQVELVRRYRTQLVTQHSDHPTAQRYLPAAIAEAATLRNTSSFRELASMILTSGDSQLIGRTLSHLDGEVGREYAFQFADRGLQRLIDPQQQAITVPIVDWLFAHEHWTVLADAAAPHPVDALAGNTHLGIVIAESMHRVGRVSAAKDLFARIARKQDAPFIASLRHAELAVQVSSVEEVRAALSDAVKKADSSREKHYADIIAGQLAIRQAKFQEARRVLQSVVHSATADDALRGRSQWLLGETYFMQRDYEAAIDEYRRCETLFPKSGWGPAALLQAGKAFERLGRPREAVVCYSNLMNKYKSSPYAELASRRMASLGNRIKR